LLLLLNGSALKGGVSVYLVRSNCPKVWGYSLLDVFNVSALKGEVILILDLMFSSIQG